MRTIRSIYLAASLAGALGGCGAKPATVESSAQPLTPLSLPVVSGNPLPGMGVTLAEHLDYGGTGNNQCHDCGISSGHDPDTSSTIMDKPLTAYVPAALPQSGLATAWSKLAPRAQSDLNDPSADNIEKTLMDIASAFNDVGANAQVTSEPPRQWIRAMKPAFARSLSSVSPYPGYVSANYDVPSAFFETIDRGARSYCAMRNAAVQAPATNMPMLDHALAKALWWKLGYTAADFTFMPINDKLDRDLSQAGAQAFVIPFAIGAQVAPLKGPLMPDFGELSHPIVWMTGDAMVKDTEHADLFGVNTYLDVQHVDAFSGKQYKGSIDIGPVLLASFGIVELELGGKLTITAGALQDPTATTLDGNEPAFSDAIGGGGFYDYFGLHTIYKDPLGAWPAPRRVGLGDSSLDIGGAGVLTAPLALSSTCVNEVGAPPLYADVIGESKANCRLVPWSDANAQHQYGLVNNFHAPIGWGTGGRWLNDDDRSFAIRDSLDMTLSVIGAGGFDLGFFKMLVEVQASVGITSWVDTVVRESLHAVDGAVAKVLPTPQAASQFVQTSFSVTPIGGNQAHIDPLALFLHFFLGPLPFIGTIDWRPEIFHLPSIPITGDPIVVAEPNRVRVGEYSEQTPAPGLGVAPGALALDSHYPASTGALASFPSMNESVAQCLAEKKQGGSEPNPKPTGPAPPALEYGLCWYGPSVNLLNFYLPIAFALGQPLGYGGWPIQPLPADVCSHVDDGKGWDALFFDKDQHACMVFTEQYLCGQLNATQAQSGVVKYLGENVIAHRIQKNMNEEDLSAKMFADCTAAFDKVQDNVIANFLGQYFMHNFVRVHECNPKTLLPDDGADDPKNQDCTPDPVTHECWSLSPCYPDPRTGLCSPTCTTPDPFTGRCKQLPQPTPCNPLIPPEQGGCPAPRPANPPR